MEKQGNIKENIDVLNKIGKDFKFPQLSIQCVAMGVRLLCKGRTEFKNKIFSNLQKIVDDNDEDLAERAEQFCKFTGDIDGPKYASCLFTPLDRLALVEETFVREKIIESLRTVANAQWSPSLERRFMTQFELLAISDRFTSRISACFLVSVIYPRVQTSVKAEVRKMFATLCSDDSPIVRRAAANRFGEFCTVLEPEFVKGEMVQMWSNFLNDDQDSVRFLSVEAAIPIIRLLDKNDEALSLMINSVKLCGEEKSWRVRYMVADKITDIQSAIGPENTKNHLITPYQGLLKDPETVVRCVAAGKVRDFVNALPVEDRESLNMAEVLPVANELVCHPNQDVKTAVADAIMELSTILGGLNITQHMLPIFLSILNFEGREVKLNVQQVLSQSLLPVIDELAKPLKN